MVGLDVLGFVESVVTVVVGTVELKALGERSAIVVDRLGETELLRGILVVVDGEIGRRVEAVLLPVHGPAGVVADADVDAVHVGADEFLDDLLPEGHDLRVAEMEAAEVFDLVGGEGDVAVPAALAVQLDGGDRGAPLLNYGIINILLILGVGIVISFIATFIPVLIASKKPPVEAIRAL